MPTQIAPKAEKKEVPAARGGALAPRIEFPFFLSRLRDEFDRLLDRFSRGWASLCDGNCWRWGLEVRDKGQTREYREQKCYQSVTLPPGIDRDKVEARYHNGVLTITHAQDR
jgi:hypothetical protein